MKPFKIIGNLIFALFLGHLVAGAAAVDQWSATAVIVGLQLIPTQLPVGSLAAIEVEIWKNDIIENFFKDNQFVQMAFNADQYVIGGKVVHIPTAGSKPGAQKNRNSLPAAVKLRTDTDIVYLIDEFTSNPILIKNAEEVELSYDKRQNVLMESQEELNELCADWLIYNWFTYTYNGTTTTGQIIRTSGASVTAHLSGSTGNRKKFVKEDLKSARKSMNGSNVPKANRFALVSTDMFDQLTDDTDLKGRDGEKGGELNLAEGSIMRLYGFDIFERSSVIRFTNASTPVAKEPGAAEGTADNDAVLCWQMNGVERAKGSVEFFENEDDPTYFGSIYSALLRVGGRIRRSVSVVAIVQTTP